MWVSTFMIPLLLRVCASRKWRNQVNFITRHEYHHENKSLTFWNFRLRPEQTRWHSNFWTPYFMNLGLGTRLERVRDKSFLPTMTLYGIQPSGEHRKTSLELLGQLHLSLINYDEENKEYSIDKIHKTTTYVTYHINITLAHDIWFDCSTTPFPHLTYITQGTVWHFFISHHLRCTRNCGRKWLISKYAPQIRPFPLRAHHLWSALQGFEIA